MGSGSSANPCLFAFFGSIPLLVGVATAAFVLLASVLIACFVCPCCPAHKKCKPAPPKKEEEATSQGVALHLPGTPESTLPRSTAPSHRPSLPTTQLCPYPHHQSHSSLTNTVTTSTGAGSDVQLHCGCHAHWSPTATITRSCGGGHHHQPQTQGSTGIPELDQLMMTLYENPAATWQPGQPTTSILEQH